MEFFFPLLVLLPAFDGDRLDRPPFSLSRRIRKTNTPDLSTLAVHHKLHFPFQFADAFLGGSRMELRVTAESLDAAKLLVSYLRLGFYLDGVTPFIVPFAASHSSEEYAGISARDRPSLAARLPPELQSGLKSGEAQVEMWPHELTLSCIYLPERVEVSASAFEEAVKRASVWRAIEGRHRELAAFRAASESAPLLISETQSYLHVWCGLEALFPKVSSEVSFRLSIYLAQLLGGAADRRNYLARFKKSYDIRSKIAHGSRDKIEHEDWEEAWSLLVDAGRAILGRGELPKEETLLNELLAPPSDAT